MHKEVKHSFSHNAVDLLTQLGARVDVERNDAIDVEEVEARGYRAIVLSPINPHSLTHRPLVVAGDSTIEVTACGVNAGTTLVVDGQVTLPLRAGDRLMVRRAGHDFQSRVLESGVHAEPGQADDRSAQRPQLCFFFHSQARLQHYG